MQKATQQLPEIKLVGITARTNNAAEMSQDRAKIGSTIQKYMSQAIPNSIPHRATPGKTFCVYTEYESDYTGDYTYLIGEEVTSFDAVPEGLTTLIIPDQHYIKFTDGPGAMPAVCINMWNKIWAMTPQTLGGDRTYVADFEIYDERAHDYQNTTLDIFIGIKNKS